MGHASAEALFLQAQIGNRAVARLLRSGRLQRKPGPAGKADAKQATQAMDRATAEALLKQRWKVGSVFVGTLDDQAKRLQSFSMDYFKTPAPPSNVPDMLAGAGWKAWSPPTGSPIWQWLVEAFEKFDQVFGGVPAVKAIGFYETEYDYRSPAEGGPSLTPQSGVGADFGGGSMAIYHAAETQATSGRVATTKSEAGKPGVIATPTASAGFEFSVMHEMGHGLIEAVHQAVDSKTLASYGAKVGWYKGRLYDGQASEVQAALDQGTVPPSQYQITQSNWNDAKWQEQPMSKYMASALSEDFPEAVAAYIAQPKALEARSRLRFEFIRANLKSFLPALQQQMSASGSGSAPTVGATKISASPESN